MAASESRSVHSYSSENGGGSSPYYDTCIFDLDDTLYPLSSGIAAACRVNIRDFMVNRLGVDPAHVVQFNLDLYKKYGTTMAGLRAMGFRYDFDDWHASVHGRLPYNLLHQDPVLRTMLHSMPQRKFVFTNGDRNHAAQVLKALGLEDCFVKVITFEDIMEFPALSAYPTEAVGLEHPEDVKKSWFTSAGPLICCKPQGEAFSRALAIAKADPKRTIFFDDSVRNIAGAKLAGLHTVLVGTSDRSEESDWAVGSIHNVREAIPELWLSNISKEEAVPVGIPVEVKA